MAPASRSDDGWLLRPFVELSRAELARARVVLGGPAPFIDPLDAAGRNMRALVRRRVWPVLEEVSPTARARFATKARRRAEDEAALAGLAERALQRVENDDAALLVPLEGMTLAVARRAVQEAVRRLAPAADPRRAGRTVERLLAAAGLVPPAPRRIGASFDLPGAVAVVERSAVRIKRRDRPAGPASEDASS